MVRDILGIQDRLDTSGVCTTGCMVLHIGSLWCRCDLKGPFQDFADLKVEREKKGRKKVGIEDQEFSSVIFDTW